MSVLVDAAVCRQRGLPRADYFLWNDDFEFTTRLLRGNTGLLCPASVAVHKTKTFGATDVDPGERFFYEVRNKIWTLRTNSLGPPERVLYGGATVRRWARTYLKSSDRRAAAVRARPRHRVRGAHEAPPERPGAAAGRPDRAHRTVKATDRVKGVLAL